MTYCLPPLRFFLAVNKRKQASNSRGPKLLEFCDYFNIGLINLLGSCSGVISHCGRFRFPIDYIFLPNSLLCKVIAAKTFEMLMDNASDYVLILVNPNYPQSLDTVLKDFTQNMS